MLMALLLVLHTLAAIVDEIIVNPMSEVGSIGVVVQLMNTLKAERKAGFERTFVFAVIAKSHSILMATSQNPSLQTYKLALTSSTKNSLNTLLYIAA